MEPENWPVGTLDDVQTMLNNIAPLKPLERTDVPATQANAEIIEILKENELITDYRTVVTSTDSCVMEVKK